MFNALARLANSRPWRVLGFTLIGFVVAGILGGPVAGLLNSDSDSFSDNGADSALAVDAVESATGQSASPDMIVLLDAGDTEAIAETTRILDDHPSVAQVVGGEGAQFTSSDKSQTYVAAFFAADADADEASEELVPELEDVDGATVGGPIPAFQEVNDHVESDLVVAELIAFPLLFLASLWVFRSAVAALLPLFVGGLTIVISLLLLRGINEGVDISIFALNLITGLGLGLSIDYSLFMVSRYREELQRLGPGPEAIVETLRLIMDRNAHQLGPRRLRLGTDDRHLLADEGIYERALARIGGADDGNEAAACLFGFGHDNLLNKAAAAAVSASCLEAPSASASP